MMKSDRHISLIERNTEWTIHSQYNDSSDWENIIKLATEKGGLLIEGRAGTGKSYVVKSAIEAEVMKLNDNTRTMSFTNKASRNILGTTIHKLLHITETGGVPKKTINNLKKYEWFVVDEIGMISNKLWRKLQLLKRECPKAKWILMGDYRQLPPVSDEGESEIDVFNHPVVKFLTNGNKIELTIRKRYNEELWDYLERGYEKADWKGITMRKVSYDEVYTNKNICYLNKTRRHINELCMEHFRQDIPSVYLRYEPQYSSDPAKAQQEQKRDKRQSAYLYEGLPVMSWKNNNKLGTINSEEFIITSCDVDNIELTREEGGETITIETIDFHNQFLVNYASTAHKSQGATYQHKVILWDWARMIEDRRLCYTACSRATSLSNLIVSSGISK